jgi:hypothetical protein
MVGTKVFSPLLQVLTTTQSIAFLFVWSSREDSMVTVRAA